MYMKNTQMSVLSLIFMGACIPQWDKVDELATDGSYKEGMEPGECTDGADNDGDGDFDCTDADCQSGPDCNENFAAGDCSDEEDNDSDGVVDCADEDCVGVDDCIDEQDSGLVDEPEDEPLDIPEEDPSGEPEEEPNEPGEPSFEGGDPQHGIEFELTWSMVGDDLDLHIIAPDVDWEDGWMTDDDCFYANCAAYSGELDWGVQGDGADDPVLMMDDIEGDGPELTVVEAPQTTGRYSVVVHDYSTQGTEGSNTVTINLYSYGTVFWSVEKELQGEEKCLLVAFVDMATGVVEDAEAEPVDCPQQGGGGPGGGPGGPGGY